MSTHGSRRAVRSGGPAWDAERGAAAVEFALVLVPLLMLLFGFIDFGRAYNAQQAVSAAAREAVRMEALGSDAATVRQRAVLAAEPVTISDADVAIGTACTSANAGQPTTVTITHQFAFLTPLPSLIPGLGSTITLTGKGEMRCGG